jgi:hypothetical protein
MLKTFILLCITVLLTACGSTRSYTEYPVVRPLQENVPRQYIRAPDGWGGKYCQMHPGEC